MSGLRTRALLATAGCLLAVAAFASPGSGSSSTGASSGSRARLSAPPATVHVSIARIGSTIRALFRVQPKAGIKRPGAAFELIALLAPRRAPSTGRLRDYRYSLTLGGLRCSGGATRLELAIVKRPVVVSCNSIIARWAGNLPPARRYVIEGASVRRRPGRKPLIGLVYALVIRLPPAKHP